MSSKCQGGVQNGVNHTTDANEYFTFYSQLQQSCIYYSNLAMRQMMVGYHNLPVGAINLPSQLKGDSDSANIRAPVSSSQNSNIRRMLDFDDEEDEKDKGSDGNDNGDSNQAQGSFTTISTGNKLAPVTVIVSNYDDGSDSGEVMGLRQQRRVNFANPLSTVKFKSPTPMHSTEELNGHTDSTRTGFTSDSEEGSDTEILCNYLRRVQSQSLQPSSAGQRAGGGGEGAAKKRKKRRKRNKNRKNQQDGDNNEEYQYENECASYWPLEVEAEDLEFINEDDPCAIYEMPLNQDDYEFISEIRKCGEEPTTKRDGESDAKGSGDGGSDKLNEMKMLYGESGSARILKMEETIEKSFMLSMRKIYNPNY